MNDLINQRTFFQKNENERIIKSKMYNNLAWTLNLLSIFMKITFHYKLSNSAQRKIFSRFLIIFGQFGKKKKNLAKWEKLCSGHLLNWKISLFLSYWTMIDVMQTRMNCVLVTVYCVSVSVWIHTYLAPSVFILHWTHPKNVVKNFYRNKIK